MSGPEKAKAPATWREPGVNPGQFVPHCIGWPVRNSSEERLSWASVTIPPDASGPWVEQWLSAGRFRTYLNAAGGDRSKGLDLYEWSARMSAAIMHDVGHLEVAVRNAYNGALEARQPGPLHWTEDLGRYFPYRRGTAANGTTIDRNDKPRRQVNDATRAAGGPSAPRGKVVAELTFGFWRYLTTRIHDGTLWVPYLRWGFPVGMNATGPVPLSRPVVDGAMGELHMLRNRVAHHEPLLSADLAARRGDLVLLLDLIDADLSRYVQSQSTWAAVEAQHP